MTTKAKGKKKEEQRREYVIYDERALYDVDKAAVLECCDSLAEAKHAAKGWGGGFCYSYAVNEQGIAEDERFEF